MIRNIVVISDTHVGCQLALQHPEGAELDNGGIAKPSRYQLKLWKAWRYFWDHWVPENTHGEPYILVHNGDAIDGHHHNSTTQWSHDMKDQREHAFKILAPEVEKAAAYYHIRGTEAHVGSSGVEEETLAKQLGAVRGSDGRYARWELLKQLGKNLIHFSHHIGTTSSSAHEASAINAEQALMFTAAGRTGLPPYNVVVRSHRHQAGEWRKPSERGYWSSIVTPAWQLKTPYVYRLAGGRTGATEIGGALIRLGDELHCRFYVQNVISVRAE